MVYDPLKVGYRQSAPVLASFSWNDVRSGTGFVEYFGGQVQETTNPTYKLSEKAFYSNEVSAWVISAIQAATKVLDLDFDVLFKLPQTLEGEALVTATIGVQGATAQQNMDIYYIAKVRKWDGVTETEIANAQSETAAFSAVAIGSTRSDVKTVPITIPRTKFKKGETLRLTMEVWGAKQSANNGFFGIGVDPKDRDDDEGEVIVDTDPTTLTFLAPFELDV